MITLSIPIAATLCLTAAACGPSGQEPGERRLHELVSALNSADPGALRRFAETGTDPEVSKQVPLDVRVETLRSVKESLGKIELVGVNVMGAGRFRAILRTEKQGTQRLEVVVGGGPEFGIQSLRLLSGDDAPERAPFFEGFAGLPELAEMALKEGKAPAIAIARCGANGPPEIVVRGKRHFGKPDEVQKEDLWLVGSIGKSMTATMIGILVDRGTLKWDTTLGEALADLPMKEGYRKVKLIELLQHRGGIPQDLTVQPGAAVTPQDLARFADGAKGASEIRARYARHILNRDPIGAPGERFRYSNAGYALAAVVAERAAGKPFETLMKELVFGPLGMDSARIDTPGRAGMPGSEGQLHGHVFESGKPEPHVLAHETLGRCFAAAGGGVAMSIGDLARYGQFHLQGLQGKARLMRQETFDALHRPAQGAGEAYACGWSVSKSRMGDTFSSHNGSDGTFQADLAIFPRRNLVVACVQNMGEEAELPIPEKVVASLARTVKPTR